MKYLSVPILLGVIFLAAACAHVTEAELKKPALSGYEKFYGDSPQFGDDKQNPCARTHSMRELKRFAIEHMPDVAQAQEAMLKNEKTATAVCAIPDIYCQELVLQRKETHPAGWLIAHEIASEFEELALDALKYPGVYRQITADGKDDKSGLSVAHVAVSEHKKAALYALDYPEIYRIAQPATAGNHAGYTVAHAAVEHFESAALYALHFPLVYRLRQHVSAPGRSGWTVAHTAVWNHEKAALEALKDPNVYYLALPAEAPQYAGYTVAHFAVMRWPSAARYALAHPTIPGLSNGSGFLVGTLARQTLAAPNAAGNPPPETPAEEQQTQPTQAKPAEINDIHQKPGTTPADSATNSTENQIRP